MRCSNNNEKCHKTGDHLGQNTKLINSDEKNDSRDTELFYSYHTKYVGLCAKQTNNFIKQFLGRTQHQIDDQHQK